MKNSPADLRKKVMTDNIEAEEDLLTTVHDVQLYFFDTTDFDGKSPTLSPSELADKVAKLTQTLTKAEKKNESLLSELDQEDRMLVDIFTTSHPTLLQLGIISSKDSKLCTWSAVDLVLNLRLNDTLAHGAVIVFHDDSKIRDDTGTYDIKSWRSLRLTSEDDSSRKRFEYLISIGFVDFILLRQNLYAENKSNKD